MHQRDAARRRQRPRRPLTRPPRRRPVVATRPRTQSVRGRSLLGKSPLQFLMSAVLLRRRLRVAARLSPAVVSTGLAVVCARLPSLSSLLTRLVCSSRVRRERPSLSSRCRSCHLRERVVRCAIPVVLSGLVRDVACASCARRSLRHRSASRNAARAVARRNSSPPGKLYDLVKCGCVLTGSRRMRQSRSSYKAGSRSSERAR